MEKEGSRRRVPVAKTTMAEMVCVRTGVWGETSRKPHYYNYVIVIVQSIRYTLVILHSLGDRT